MSYPLADALYQQLLDALPPGRPYDRAALESDALPRLVGHYLRHALQGRVDDALGRLRSMRGDAFDHHHPDVQAAYEQYAAALTAHVQVPGDEWAATLRDAVDRVAAYLVRPADTLAADLYQDVAGPLPAHHVLRGMAAFAAYPYLRDVLGAYIEQKDAESFDRGRLTTLLGRIDREMTKPYTADDWLGLLRPLFDLAHHAGLNAVSTDTLRTFFATRGADAIAERLEARARRGDTELDETTLRPLLEGRPPTEDTPAFRPRPAVDLEPIAHPEPIARAERLMRPEPVDRPEPTGRLTKHTRPEPIDRPEQPDRPKPAVWETGARETQSTPAARPEKGRSVPAPAAASEKDAVPLWKKFQGVRPASEKPQRPSPAPTPSGEAVPLWKRFHKAPEAPASPGTSPSPHATSGPTPRTPQASAVRRHDLTLLEQEVLGDGAEQDRRRYIRDLFSGSEADYAAVLTRLQETDSWAEASGIIASDVFRRHQVNIYSDVAIAFTDAAERRYRS